MSDLQKFMFWRFITNLSVIFYIPIFILTLFFENAENTAIGLVFVTAVIMIIAFIMETRYSYRLYKNERGGKK